MLKNYYEIKRIFMHFYMESCKKTHFLILSLV
jgi:hypothetical protein